MEDYTDRLAIRQWAEEDRPREKLLLKGKAVLSDAELIAILIGSGTTTMSAVDLAKHILHHTDNDLNALARLSVKDLTQFRGIGEAKAIAIISALELGRRRKNTEVTQRPKLSSSKIIYEVMRPHLEDLDVEEFWVLNLRRNNELISKTRLSIGGLEGTVVDVRVIFRQALQELATFVVLAHNHPSGSLRPSPADERITKKIAEAGRLLDIHVVDHVIVSNNGYYSFADESKL